MMKSQKRQKGFALIELAIVIAIIGILIAAIVPEVIKYHNKKLGYTQHINKLEKPGCNCNCGCSQCDSK